jgi:hypothetical protein
MGTVSIAHWPCQLAKIELPPSSIFLVGIICLIPPPPVHRFLHVRIINIELKTEIIIRIFQKFAVFFGGLVGGLTLKR